MTAMKVSMTILRILEMLNRNIYVYYTYVTVSCVLSSDTQPIAEYELEQLNKTIMLENVTFSDDISEAS